MFNPLRSFNLSFLSGLNRDRLSRFEDSGRSKIFYLPMSFDSLWDVKICKKKICLLCKLTEILAVCLHFGKIKNQQIKVKKCRKIIFGHKIIMKS